MSFQAPEDLLPLCRKAIALDSSPSNGCRELVHFFAELGKSAHLGVEIQEELSEDIPEANLLLRPKPPDGSQEFLFLASMDTYDPGPFGLWKLNSGNPFDATLAQGLLYGLGSASGKLDWIAKFLALRDSLQEKSHHSGRPEFQLTPLLAGTFGGLKGMTGAFKVIRRNKLKPKMALIWAPSDLRILSAGKGLAIVEIHIPFTEAELDYRRSHDLSESTSTQSKLFHIRPGQASPIHQLLDYALQLPEGAVAMDIQGGAHGPLSTRPAAHAYLEFDLVPLVGWTSLKRLNLIFNAFKKMKSEAHLLNLSQGDLEQQIHFEINRIQTVQTGIEVHGSLRSSDLNSQGNPHFSRMIEDFGRKCQEVDSHMTVLDSKRPFQTDSNNPFLKGAVSELSKILNFESGESTALNHSALLPAHSEDPTEASLFHRLGTHCLCFGAADRPDPGKDSHEESIPVAKLEASYFFYRSMIRRFCL